MIPIRDTTPAKTVPIVNSTLIGVNVFVFLIQLLQGSGINRFIFYYGLVPARYTVPEFGVYFTLGEQLFAFISFMFLHGGFWHILGNMWFLFVFGDNVEDHLGPFRYLGFYLACGVISGFCHLLLNFQSNIPVVGASGAIAGVMGAYFLLHPGSRILTMVPIFIFPFFFELPAFVFLGVWFFMQFFNATASYAAATGVAWWAHVGGFVAGMALIRLFSHMPITGASQVARQLAERKQTHRLQVIHPSGPMDSPDLYGEIRISPYEALRGARKLINIPWGFHKQLFQVIAPPDTQDGDTLRVPGLGRRAPGGGRGDLFLTVLVGAG